MTNITSCSYQSAIYFGIIEEKEEYFEDPKLDSFSWAFILWASTDKRHYLCTWDQTWNYLGSPIIPYSAEDPYFTWQQ